MTVRYGRFIRQLILIDTHNNSSRKRASLIILEISIAAHKFTYKSTRRNLTLRMNILYLVAVFSSILLTKRCDSLRLCWRSFGSLYRSHSVQTTALHTRLAEKLGGIVEFISGQSVISETNIEVTLKVTT